MAVDTRDKRMSMIGLASPTPTVLPNADGSVGTQDRAMFLWLYHGLALSVATVISVICDFSVTVDDILGFDVEVGC